MQTPAARPLHVTCSQRPVTLFTLAATLLLLSATAAFSETTIASDPLQMRECPQTDGVPLYTNKKLPGCTLMTLKPLSIVPSLSDMPTYRPSMMMTAPRYDTPSSPDRHQRGMASKGEAVPH